MVIIQLINVRWTAKSRGAPEANRRNQVAKSLPMNVVQSEFVFEIYRFSESDGFVQPAPIHVLNDHMPKAIANHFPEYQVENLIINSHDKPSSQRLNAGQYRTQEELATLFLEIQNNHLVVGFHWNQDIGKPFRHDKRVALNLQQGEFGRLIVNGRHPRTFDESPIWYSQHTYNIALVEKPTPDWFIARQPAQICDLQANLF